MVQKMVPKNCGNLFVSKGLSGQILFHILFYFLPVKVKTVSQMSACIRGGTMPQHSGSTFFISAVCFIFNF
jgi:hypothetical protein